jgi:azurin
MLPERATTASSNSRTQFAALTLVLLDVYWLRERPVSAAAAAVAAAAAAAAAAAVAVNLSSGSELAAAKLRLDRAQTHVITGMKHKASKQAQQLHSCCITKP